MVVYGATPGGLAAVTAARLEDSVALIEHHNHLGGMSASGLGNSDIETREAIDRLFREFVEPTDPTRRRTAPGERSFGNRLLCS